MPHWLNMTAMILGYIDLTLLAAAILVDIGRMIDR